MNSDQYTNKIKELREASDTKINVKVSHGQNSLLIRDIRELQEGMISPRVEENYLINAINTIRASQKLCEISTIEENAKGKLSKTLEELFNQITSSYDKNADNITEKQCLNIFQHTERQCLKILREYSVGKSLQEKEYKLLTYAKNLSGLEDEHPDILTILSMKDSENENSFYAIRSTKICKLTEQQKQQYQDLQNKEWYQALPKWKQSLITAYQGKLTDGEHLIPTQIRDIPGIKNAYRTEVLTVDPDNPQKDKTVIYSFSHSGTLASLSKDKEIRETIASDNLQELQENLPDKNKALHFFTLNTDNKFDYADRQCIAQTENAFTKQRFRIQSNDFQLISDNRNQEQPSNKYHSNAPLNILRLFSRGKYNHIERSLQGLALTISKADTLDILLIGNKSNDKKARHNITTLLAGGRITKEFSDILEAAIEVKRLIQQSKKTFNFFGNLRQNYNFKITNAYAKLQMALHDVEQAHQNGQKNILVPSGGEVSIFTSGKDKITSPVFTPQNIHIACKSGKDRTGAMVASVINTAITRDRAKKASAVKDMKTAIINSGHGQSLNGRSGGTPGCAATKSLSGIFSFNAPNKGMNALCRKVANYTQTKNIFSPINKIKHAFSSPFRKSDIFQELSSTSQKINNSKEITPKTQQKQKERKTSSRTFISHVGNVEPLSSGRNTGIKREF